MGKDWQRSTPWWHSPLCMKVWVVSHPNDCAIPTSPCFPEITGKWEKNPRNWQRTNAIELFSVEE